MIGMLLFMFATWVSGDILQGDITAYSKTFQKQLKDAQQAFQAEQWQDALRLYRALAEEAPDLPIVHIGEGDAAAKLKDYPTAITAFQRALQRLSTEQQADISVARLQFIVQAKLAAAYHRNKQLDEADIWFQKAVKGAGEDAPAAWYVALGQIETERGNLEQARRYYIVAVQLHPETTAAYNNLGHVLLKLNRIDEADAVFREALTQDETLASAAFGRGKVGTRRGQLDVARRFYEHAVQHAPHEPTFHKSLAGVLRGMGNEEGSEAAEMRYRRTLAERYLRQAHWFIEKKQLQHALAPLQKALETDGTFIPALKDYAYVQMQLGELAAAKQTYRRVLTVEPTSRQALLHLGMIESKLGNTTNAAGHYLTLIKHDPDFMDTYVQLANLHERSGDLALPNKHLQWGYNTNRGGHPDIYGVERFTKSRARLTWQKLIFVVRSNSRRMCRFRKKHWHPCSQRKIGNLPKHLHLLRLSLKAIADRHTVPRLPMYITASSAFPMRTVRLKPLLRKPLNILMF